MDESLNHSTEMCSCGRPLHYDNPETQAAVEMFINTLGPALKITLPSLGRTYIVPRHFIALHGIEAATLPDMGFPESLPTSQPIHKQFQKRKLNVWTVYDHPDDYKHGFIARRFETSADGPKITDDVIMSPDVEAIRKALELQGLYRLERADTDDPNILESWL